MIFAPCKRIHTIHPLTAKRGDITIGYLTSVIHLSNNHLEVATVQLNRVTHPHLMSFALALEYRSTQTTAIQVNDMKTRFVYFRRCNVFEPLSRFQLQSRLFLFALPLSAHCTLYSPALQFRHWCCIHRIKHFGWTWRLRATHKFIHLLLQLIVCRTTRI